MDLLKYATENKVPIIEEEGLEFIVELIKSNNVRSILEVGTAIGYSSTNFASVSKDIFIDTIERNEKMHEVAVKVINDTEYSNQITVHFMDAFDFEPSRKYDLIFIDAAKAQYRRFFEKFEKNLTENGVIVCDNLKFHGLVEMRKEVKSRDLRQLLRKINDFVGFLETNEEFHTSFYDVGDGISVSKRR